MYVGKIINGVVGHVFVKDLDRQILRDGEQPIDLCLQHVNHSPTGFAWGYYGSGPAQAAFAILFDYLKDKNRVMRMYQQFKDAIVARLPMDEDFTLCDREIEDFITKFDIERMQEN